MNYLTNYYKNLASKLESEVNALESEVKMINESMTTYAAMGPRRVSGTMGVGMGGQSQAFSGSQLGQLLAQGNMNAVNQYLGQFGGQYATQSGPAAYSSGGYSANQRRRVAGSAGGPAVNSPMADEEAGGPVSPIPGDYNNDGRVDGADLGMALGQGANTSGVLQNWSTPFNQAGPAAAIYGGNPQISRRPRNATDFGMGAGGQGQAFSGAQLGQLLGQGNMNAVNQYLGQFGGQYPTQGGPASMQAMMNRARSARRGAGRSATGQ